MKRLLARIWNFWAVRSYLAGGVGTLAEIIYVVPMVEWLGTPRVLAVASGQVLGASVAFVVNKYFAFRDKDPRIGWQATKYLAVFCAQLALHSAMTATMIHRLGFHYLIAKFVADFGIFVVMQLFALRYFVFPQRREGGPVAQRRAGGGGLEPTGVD